MKNLKKISRKELTKISGGYVPVEGGGNECVLNWIKCPGQKLRLWKDVLQ